MLASFDAANHIKILSSSGSLTCSSIDIVAEIGDEENIAAARRFGLMVDDTQVTTRFAGGAFIPGTGDASVDNVVTMTFDKNDSYNLDFVFDRRAESRLSSTSDMAFTLNGLNVVDGDASAVAAAINAAVAANETDGDGGSDMTGSLRQRPSAMLFRLSFRTASKLKFPRQMEACHQAMARSIFSIMRRSLYPNLRLRPCNSKKEKFSSSR